MCGIREKVRRTNEEEKKKRKNGRKKNENVWGTGSSGLKFSYILYIYIVIENHICGVYNHKKKKKLSTSVARTLIKTEKKIARAYGHITFLLSGYYYTAAVTTVPPPTRHPQPLQVGIIQSDRARTTKAAACLPTTAAATATASAVAVSGCGPRMCERVHTYKRPFWGSHYATLVFPSRSRFVRFLVCSDARPLAAGNVAPSVIRPIRQPPVPDARPRGTR